MKLKVFSTFSGIGAFEKALENLDIDHEVVKYCEINRYAAKAYSILHGVPESDNLIDITTVNEKEMPEYDLITYGFPCQDISVAGHQRGIIEGETRSGLVHEIMRIIKHNKPKFAICENVKNLVGKKFKKEFDWILAELESYGYKNYYKVLNSKNHGIPQNRERVFIVSIRADIKQDFKFPESYDSGIRLRDILQDVVPEKYYISPDKCEKLLEQLKDKQLSNTIRTSGRGSLDRHTWDLVAIPVLTPDRVNKRQNGRRFKEDGDPSFTVTTADRHGVLVAGNVGATGHHGEDVYFTDGIAPTLKARDYKGPVKIVTVNTNKIDVVGMVDMGTFRSRNEVYNPNGISPCLRTMQGGGLQPKVIIDAPSWRIRKLTPLECFRLMGFADDDFYKLKEAGISDSQLYKMAGNSIVVNVLQDIFQQLFLPEVKEIPLKQAS